MPTAGAAMQAYSVFDFSRGLDLKTSPLKLALLKAQNALRQARNAIYTSSGAVSTRWDIQNATNSSIGASVIVTGGVEFVKSNGDRVVVCGTNDGRVFTIPTAGGAPTQIRSGLTAGTKWYFATYHDKLLIGNRADAPQKYDGSTIAALGGTPPSKGGPVAVHGNRVFWLDGTNKSTLYWSALNAEEDYTTPTNAGSAEISPNDGTMLKDLVPGINELILLKENRPYRLQGTSPSTFTIANVVPTTGSVGAISTQAAVFAANQVRYAALSGVVSLATIQQFGDLREAFDSDKISPYWEPDSDVLLSIVNLGGCVMAYDSQWNRLYLAVDTNADAVNDTVLVYDIALKAWSVWDGISIASMWSVRNPTSGLSEIWAGGYNGHVRVLNRDVATNAIPCHVTHLSVLGSPGMEKSVRHLFLYFKEEGNYSVNVTTRFDFGATGGQVYTASLLGGSKTLGVNWVLGVDPLGAQSQIVKRVDTHGTGEFMEIEVSNENAGQEFTWYGYEALSRPRRVVRRGTAAV